MQESTPSQAGDAADAFGAQRRPRRRAWLVVAGIVVLVRLLLIMLSFSSARALLHIGSPYPSCTAAGISTAAGREGVCARGNLLTGPYTLYNVVDRGHVLHMPEYEARWLATDITPTRVPNALENEDLYPRGVGQLVSIRLMITNTGDRPLHFGPGVGYEPVPSYPKHRSVELSVPTRSGSNEHFSFPATINGRRAPTPSVFQRQPIAAHGRLVGWVTFVAPSWSPSVLGAKGADVDFLRSDASSDYVGQIRLWK
jgi:hypothetical protein